MTHVHILLSASLAMYGYLTGRPTQFRYPSLKSPVDAKAESEPEFSG